jgi:predicted transcriptional regulator
MFQAVLRMDSRRKEEVEDVVIQALGHRERRNILKIIHSAEDGASYSEILGELGLNTGRMNYHLRQLEGLIERNEERRYHLTPLGARSLGVLGSIAEGLNGGYEPYLSAARFSQAGSIHPTVTGIIWIGIAFDLLFVLIWGYIGSLAYTEGGPAIIVVVSSILFVLGLIGLSGLIRALRTAPEFVRKLERKLGVS